MDSRSEESDGRLRCGFDGVGEDLVNERLADNMQKTDGASENVSYAP